MLNAVLFDLDGTLLDIELDSFLNDYFALLKPVVAGILGHQPDNSAGLRAVITATQVMSGPHPGETNREAFNRQFDCITGVKLDTAEASAVLERFYREVFPTLRGQMGPRPGAVEVVETALALGLKVAIATNPIFPMSAVRERMRWAGLERAAVDAITAYEFMNATKPHGAYYLQTAEMMSVDPRACIMVGDDRALDMSAADVGMRTFYVGNGPVPACDWAGNLSELSELLKRLTD